MSNNAPRVSASGNGAIAIMHKRGGFRFDRGDDFDPKH